MLFLKNYVALETIVANEVIRFSRIWSQTFLPPVITMTLYFLIFGSFIGAKIGNIDHVTFMQYMAPGLIMMGIITNSYANVVSSFYSLRFQRSIEELLVSPVPNYIILLGFTIGGILRGVIVGILIGFVALFFTHFTMHNYLITITVTILTAALFSLAGFTNAIYARNFDDIQIVPTFILTPLTYLGGVFYSISQLPPIWQQISKANPIVYIVNTFRYGILGTTDVPIISAFIIIIVANVLLYALNLYLLRKGTGIRT
jgi:ABC-2 type transport system permease protein